MRGKKIEFLDWFENDVLGTGNNTCGRLRRRRGRGRIGRDNLGKGKEEIEEVMM